MDDYIVINKTFTPTQFVDNKDENVNLIRTYLDDDEHVYLATEDKIKHQWVVKVYERGFKAFFGFLWDYFSDKFTKGVETHAGLSRVSFDELRKRISITPPKTETVGTIDTFRTAQLPATQKAQEKEKDAAVVKAADKLSPKTSPKPSVTVKVITVTDLPKVGHNVSHWPNRHEEQVTEKLRNLQDMAKAGMPIGFARRWLLDLPRDLSTVKNKDTYLDYQYALKGALASLLRETAQNLAKEGTKEEPLSSEQLLKFYNEAYELQSKGNFFKEFQALRGTDQWTLLDLTEARQRIILKIKEENGLHNDVTNYTNLKKFSNSVNSAFREYAQKWNKEERAYMKLLKYLAEYSTSAVKGDKPDDTKLKERITEVFEKGVKTGWKMQKEKGVSEDLKKKLVESLNNKISQLTKQKENLEGIQDLSAEISRMPQQKPVINQKTTAEIQRLKDQIELFNVAKDAVTGMSPTYYQRQIVINHIEDLNATDQVVTPTQLILARRQAERLKQPIAVT